MVTREDLLQCRISSWYKIFEDHTFRSVILPLPDEFVAWLLEDGLFLPESSSAFPARNKRDAVVADDDYRDWSSEDEASAAAAGPPDLPDLLAALEGAIADLGGAVAPKLTWSVPKDAIWAAAGTTLRCTTPDQVLLLLKASDRAAHDLSEALAAADGGGGSGGSAAPPDGHALALRKWYDLRPGREFRCFVVGGRLAGVSQRDLSRRYEELEAEESGIRTRIEGFHAAVVAARGFPLRSFTYDVYVPAAAGAAVRLVDFNPAGGTTAPLLFEWEDLLGAGPSGALGGGGEGSEGARAVDFRIIREDVALRPDTALYGVPYDFVDFSEGSALSALMERARAGNAAADEE